MRLIEIDNIEKLVICDGVTLSIDFNLAENIKSVYFDSSVNKGFIEKTYGEGVVIESINEYKNILDAFENKINTPSYTDFYFRIIFDDKIVDVNGVAIEINNLEDYKINSNYHAVQWDKNNGFIETKSGRNIDLVNIDEFSPILEAHEAILEQRKLEEQARLEYENSPENYAQKRLNEYPPMADYIDGIVKGDDAQVQAYIDACQAVKEKYPKP